MFIINMNDKKNKILENKRKFFGNTNINFIGKENM